MATPAASFLAAAQTAQVGAGIIAARSRGDLASADALLEGLDDRARAAGFLLLADLAVALLAAARQTSGDSADASGRDRGRAVGMQNA